MSEVRISPVTPAPSEREGAAGRHTLQPLFHRWFRLGLAEQFFITSAIVLLAGMASIGWWVSTRIEHDVTENTAQAAAIYLTGAVGPLVQELEGSPSLSTDTIKRLDALLEQSPIREHIVSMKIWNLDATITYSKWRDMIGKNFPPSENFSAARSGRVAAEFSAEPHEEDWHERLAGQPLLEIYAPVWANDSLKVIAVSEFYANGSKLQSDIREATLLSWVVVAGVCTIVLAALSGIVYGGSRTIERQRNQLTQQVHELELLQGRLRQSSLRTAAINERVLQRIGADLHDGPAQLLSFVLLRLKRFRPLIEPAGQKEVEELDRIRTALADTLTEVRNISTGLSLPRLGNVTLQEAVAAAVGLHEDHTGTKVAVNASALPDVGLAFKICIYRFIQEGLTNAFRHGGGEGQAVNATVEGDTLVFSVSDQGPGFGGDAGNSTGLGLTGMRARVEALGGDFTVEAQCNPGARVTARFALNAAELQGENHAEQED